MDRKQIDIYKAILKIDDIMEPFSNFKPNFPQVGDRVKPSDFYSYDFTYKLDSSNGRPADCSLSLEEVYSHTWICKTIRHTEYHLFLTFQSVEKIRGRRRSITYKDPWNFKAEIADMPEKAKLIIRYKNGELPLLELLKIFREKGYHSTIRFKSILLDMDGDDYLQAMKELSIEAAIRFQQGLLD